MMDMAEEVNAILKDKSVAELEELAEDIKYHLKEQSSRIDEAFMTSILFDIPQMIADITNSRPAHVKRIRLNEALIPQVKPEEKQPTTQSKPGNTNSIELNDRGMTPGEQKLWDEQSRLRLEEGETVFLSPLSVFVGTVDKRQSRAPHYFNRVKSGYLWTEYNRLHYTEDNPPPEQVLGYKFNIFYPDLLDHLKTPTYRLLPGRSGQHLRIHFTAGPPYEDVEFEIVNKEWETNHRLGFKCVFERGSLQLYFNFKKDIVRR